MSNKRSVLFVCLGNICRSPMAEAVFLDILKTRNQLDDWLVDSAAIIDYHVGKEPEIRTISTLKKHQITDYQHRVRQITGEDFNKFDYILGMDETNILTLEKLSQSVVNCKAIISLLGIFDPKKELIIPDPYYNEGSEMFDKVYEQCLRTCTGFINSFSVVPIKGLQKSLVARPGPMDWETLDRATSQF